MNISELIETLEKIRLSNPGLDVKVLSMTTIGTLVEINHVGTVKVVPIVPGSDKDRRPYNRQLLPGYEWRIPVNSQDEPDTEREVHFLISL